MSFKLKIPFHTLSLQLEGGIFIHYPITDKNAFHIGQNKEALAKRFSELYQSKILDEGNLIGILNEYREGEFHKNETTVHFPEAADGVSYPELDLQFQYYYNKSENGYWGVIPALGLEAFGRDSDELIEGLQEIIKLEFLKNKRLKLVQDILETIWYKSVDISETEISFRIPTPREIDLNIAEKTEGLLPKVAHCLKIEAQQLFEYEKEMAQLIRDAQNKYSRNILLVGPPGVGKTTLIREFARIKKHHKITVNIWETTASLLIKELMFGGGWKPNLVILAKELFDGNDFLFVRNLMELFEVGKYEGNTVSMAEYMKTFLAKGEINLISECTDDELAKIELENPGFISLFHLIRLQQPKGRTLEAIIKNKILSIGAHEKVAISTGAVQEMIRLTKRFTPYEGMPGSPIRFLERLVLRRIKPSAGNAKISSSEVIEQFCLESGLPVFIVDADIPIDLNTVQDFFEKNIFGQKKAINAVVDTLAAVKMALTKKDKPISSLLFTGPTGVGKTELAKTLAAFMFGSRDRMIRFDMSEYADPNSIFRLSGFAGQEGLLSDAIRKNPFSVLLFDEVEKADQGFFDLLLQILGEGRLTDGTGKLVNFCSTIILMTSNIGVGWLKRTGIKLKHQSKQDSRNILSEQLGDEVQKFFRPELYNRIDKVVIFEPLDTQSIRFIVDREINAFYKMEGIKYRKISIDISPDVFDHLGKKGYDDQYGARYLQRTIRESLIIPIARTINGYEANEQLILRVFLNKGQIEIETEEDPLGFELLLEELEISNFANHSSGLRRSINSLREGHLYARLLSELELMESMAVGKKSSKNVWKDPRKARKFSEYYDLKQTHETLCKEIEQYEKDLSLAYLNLTTYNPELNLKLDSWQWKYFNYKKQLLGVLMPSVNTCHFAVYGRQPEIISSFYFKLFKKMGFNVDAYAVWFREKYYFEEVHFEIAGSDAVTAGRKGPREQYLKKHIVKEVQPQSFISLHKNDILYGVEFVVTGRCAFLTLKSETGIQGWQFSPQEERLFLTFASDKLLPTPKQIHRAEMYKRSRSMRKIDAFKAASPLFMANRGGADFDLMEWLESHLSEQLIIEVEQAFE